MPAGIELFDETGRESMTEFEAEKTQAAEWFRKLRDSIVTEFHALEDRHPGAGLAGRVEVTKTKRTSDDLSLIHI